MVRVTLTAIAAAVATLVLAGSALSHSSTTPTLVGTVGQGGFHITLTKGGTAVKTLRHGTYKFVIHDKSSIHAFSLDGPNGFAHDFSKIPFVGNKTATITLKAGKYKYYCPNHESFMFGRFRVT
jgi:plastocyanin